MKIKEGGVMDIQKARAELKELPEIKEALQFIDGFDGYKYHSINNHRSADWLNGALYAWQAAKAQTVPEGFVAVEKKLIKTLHEELLDHEPDSFVVNRDICELWEQAEAQEPANDRARD